MKLAMKLTMTSVCPVCFQGIAFADMILSKPSDAISSDQPLGMFSITYVWISCERPWTKPPAICQSDNQSGNVHTIFPVEYEQQRQKPASRSHTANIVSGGGGGWPRYDRGRDGLVN